MKRFFSIYEYAGPLLLLPLAYYLWYQRYDGDYALVALTLFVPILFAYVIPGIGTNFLKLWEFNTRFRLGRFRPHHGFVFGSATSILVFISTDMPATGLDIAEILKSGFVVGSMLAFWNWLYDFLAIKSGFIIVHKQPYFEDDSPATLAAEHAPVIFGMFGATYGMWLSACQSLLLGEGLTGQYWLFFVTGCTACLCLPVATFVALSYFRYGVSGLKAIADGSEE